MIKYTIVRAALSVAAARNLEIRQGDVTVVFLGGDLPSEQEVYLLSLKEMGLGPDEVLKLLKSIYGLRISPLIWNSKLHKTLVELGLRRSLYDTDLYYSVKKEIYVLVFVDDIIIIVDA